MTEHQLEDEVDRALAVADLRVLAACLHHMTGDRRWLEPPFQPMRDVRLIADPTAGFGPDEAAEMVATARAWLLDRPPSPAIADPGREDFAEMISTFLGEVVPTEYLTLIREDFGFEPADSEWHKPEAAGRSRDVLIVGAGVSGLCLAIKLIRLGIDVRIVEKNADVGGTWFENRYPGCGVDTPNHFYSFSFAPNPDWKHFFSPRDELHGYVKQVADDFGLRDRVEFNSTVESVTWNDDVGEWSLDISNNGERRTTTAGVVVFATGHFNIPVAPTFPGEDDFAGEVLHTARWPADADLAGKKVAVIGTGASSMQLVPTIASEVDALTIFQRTPQWVRPVPEYNEKVSADSHWLFEHVPFYDRWYRFAQFWRYGDGLLRFLRKDPDWPHPERSMNRINERHRVEMVDFITAKLADRPDLLDRCIPDYPAFGKRILIDNGWFDTLIEPHVKLETDSIERFTRTGITTASGTEHEADVIVLATGFDVTTLASRAHIVGQGGKTLAEDWADDNPRALLGITVPSFPNLFVMYGPNTNMGHGGSGIWLAEAQSRYISDLLVDMAEHDLAAVECRPERRDDYTTEIDRLHADLIWAHPGTGTYYRNQHGQVRSPMPHRLVDYWSMLREGGLEDFVTRPKETASP